MERVLTVTKGDVLEVMMQEIIQDIDKPETPTVDRMMARFEHQWQTTADLCVRRAVELEEEAKRLRAQAAHLLKSCVLTEAVKDTVIHEIEARRNAGRLALVNPSS